MKGLIPLLGLALLLPGTAEAEVVAPGVSQGALAVARDGSPRVAWIAGRRLLLATRDGAWRPTAIATLPTVDGRVAGVSENAVLVEGRRTWIRLVVRSGSRWRVLVVADAPKRTLLGVSGFALDASGRPAVGVCPPGGGQRNVAPPRPARGERAPHAHEDHPEGLPHEPPAARGCPGALAGRHDPGGRELLPARRERNPLASRGEALVGPGPPRERARCRPPPPLRGCGGRRGLRRVDDPVHHVRREPPRPLVAHRPLDVARAAPERVRSRARARPVGAGDRRERARRPRGRLSHRRGADRAGRSGRRLRGHADRRPSAAARTTGRARVVRAACRSHGARERRLHACAAASRVRRAAASRSTRSRPGSPAGLSASSRSTSRACSTRRPPSPPASRTASCTWTPRPGFRTRASCGPSSERRVETPLAINSTMIAATTRR